MVSAPATRVAADGERLKGPSEVRRGGPVREKGLRRQWKPAPWGCLSVWTPGAQETSRACVPCTVPAAAGTPAAAGLSQGRPPRCPAFHRPGVPLRVPSHQTSRQALALYTEHLRLQARTQRLLPLRGSARIPWVPRVPHHGPSPLPLVPCWTLRGSGTRGGPRDPLRGPHPISGAKGSSTTVSLPLVPSACSAALRPQGLLPRRPDPPTPCPAGRAVLSSLRPHPCLGSA